MKSVLINMARLNLCRTIWHRWHAKYSDKECRDAFVAAMNAQTKEWGMLHTHWINPSGLGENGVYSQSNANDLAVMALRTFAIERGKFHGKDEYALSIVRPYLIPGYRTKRKVIQSTTAIGTIGDNYPIIGAKTGSGDGYQTLVMVCQIGKNVVSGAIMNANDEQGRFDAMDELMRLGEKILHGDKKAIDCPIVNAKNACLYAISDSGEIKCIYTQSADEESAPMSTTKVMTLALLRKYELDWTQQEFITPFDIKGTEDDILHDWERLSVLDLVHAMMQKSSNVAANALARIVGEKMLKEQ